MPLSRLESLVGGWNERAQGLPCAAARAGFGVFIRQWHSMVVVVVRPKDGMAWISGRDEAQLVGPLGNTVGTTSQANS